MKSIIMTLAIAGTLVAATARAEEAPLVLAGKIPLGEVRGRIDHLAVDLQRNRLFVAELENDTVAIVDLRASKLLQVISGLKQPQGVGYHPATDTLYVANGGDGTVMTFRGDDYRAIATIPLGDDADNVRVDAAANQILVGYGDGALAVIDPRAFSSMEARSGSSSTFRPIGQSSSSIPPHGRAWPAGRPATAAIFPWP
jgi:DNA-binding beta-propeller fold protein YncE